MLLGPLPNETISSYDNSAHFYINRSRIRLAETQFRTYILEDEIPELRVWALNPDLSGKDARPRNTLDFFRIKGEAYGLQHLHKDVALDWSLTD